MQIVSMDIETTGKSPDWCQVLEIGAVFDDLSRPQPIEDLPTFHCYVLHEKIVGEPFALSMHPVILRRIAEQEPGYYYYEIHEVAEIFNNWLCEHYPNYPEKDRINFAGKNFGVFDLQFLKNLPSWDDWVKYRHRVLDPAMWFVQRKDSHLPDSKKCMERAGLKGDVKHTALEDAFDVIRELRAGWKNLVK